MARTSASRSVRIALTSGYGVEPAGGRVGMRATPASEAALSPMLRRAGAHPGVGPLALCDARRRVGRLLAVERLAGVAPGRGAAGYTRDVVEADLRQELRRAQRARPRL